MYLSRKGKKDGEIVPEVRYVGYLYLIGTPTYSRTDCKASGREPSFNP
jgi:hypothetical protein